LWLLAFLTPYLFFSFAAIPHFHADEIVASSALKANAQSQRWHQANARQHAAECFLCDWSVGSQAQSLAVTQALPQAYSSFTHLEVPLPFVSTHAVSRHVRGPPFSL
jgi:hypothetical protein